MKLWSTTPLQHSLPRALIRSSGPVLYDVIASEVLYVRPISGGNDRWPGIRRIENGPMAVLATSCLTSDGGDTRMGQEIKNGCRIII